MTPSLTHYQRHRKAVEADAADPLQKAVVFKQFDVEVESLADRRVRFVVTTSTPDREKDVVVTTGIDTSAYEKNGVVMWAHDYRQLPVGRCVAIERGPDKMICTVEFATADMNPLAEQVYRMIKAGFLKACSIGFRPLTWDYDDERGGVDFQTCEMLEFSICPIPANAEALVAASKAGIDVSVIKAWAEQTLGAFKAIGPGDADPRDRERVLLGAAPSVTVEGRSFSGDLAPFAETTKSGDEFRTFTRRDMAVRWNPQLSKAFDVAAQEFPARSLEQDLSAKYCGCQLKDLYHREESVTSTRMGAFLVALDETLKGMTVDDVRNLDYGGKESPPLYERIQLNSTRAEEFMVDGLRFMQWNGTKVALRVEPRWYGMQVTTYAERKHADAARAIFSKTFARAKELNFLKGEAFSLSGEFLTRGDASMDDVFLSDKNQGMAARLLKLLNEGGASIENRGVILLGPPGNGKTLLGRILMDQAEATFVWCAARDFYYSGGTYGLMSAFEIARESAAAGVPAILFIEDVDNYLDGPTTDLMKTEMDGIAQSRGIVTILTTNYPEHLPKALIDRPGRFHDVLRFDLPDAAVRAQMLGKWLPDLQGAALQETVKALHGYGGAHVREFARFASIIRAQDGVDVATAARSALAKLQEQRDLITSVQTQGSRYRAPQAIVTAAAALRASMTKISEMATLARTAGAAPEAFAQDAVGWKAFTKARDRAGRKAAQTDAQLADLLGDYGFDAQAAVLRQQIGEPDGLPPTPAPAAPADPGEEDAELVGYQTLAALLAQAAASVAGSARLVAALIAAETETPTATADGEAAEENVETARLAAVRALALQAIGTLQSVCELACDLDEDDPADAGMDVTQMATGGIRGKAGRVLSKKNHEHILNAKACVKAADDHMQAVLDSVGRDDTPDDDETDAERALRAEPELVIEIVDGEAGDDLVLMFDDDDVPPARQDTLEVDMDLVLSGVRAVLVETVARETRAAIAAIRGRLD